MVRFFAAIAFFSLVGASLYGALFVAMLGDLFALAGIAVGAALLNGATLGLLHVLRRP